MVGPVDGGAVGPVDGGAEGPVDGGAEGPVSVGTSDGPQNGSRPPGMISVGACEQAPPVAVRSLSSRTETPSPSL